MYESSHVAGLFNSFASTVSRLLITGVLLTLTVPVALAQAQRPNDDAAASHTSVREQLIGSWRLVSRESRRENGQVEIDQGLATLPLGVLIYDQSGHVAAQLSRRDRTVSIFREDCPVAAETKGTPDNSQTVLGYDAYFGTYTLNEKEGIVTHHLEAAIWPGDIGKDIDRHFRISGDRLTITFNTTTKEGVKVTRILVWERMR
jgi:Lipocalin-like domain